MMGRCSPGAMETEGNWVMGTMCECTGNLIVWGGGGGGVGWCLVRMNFLSFR